jgi:Zn-dependent peptidase ImmA (M78 family)
VAEHGSAILAAAPGAAANALKKRREDIGLTVADLERILKGLPVADAELAESSTPIQALERLAFMLGLDERLLAFDLKAGSDDRLSIRLRTLLHQQKQALSRVTTLALSEAASIVRTQNRLASWLGSRQVWLSFEKSPDYGDAVSPAYKIGYQLATHARQRLGLGLGPVASLRSLVEEQLGIPVVQEPLPESIAGATIATGEDRGIVLNTRGSNQHVWVRRATLAHELGHLLFDPAESMNNLRVDLYRDTERDPEDTKRFPDFVEQRANAFAIAFLAPPESVRELIKPPISQEALAKVMRTFGISLTAAKYHVSNSYWRSFDVEPWSNPKVEPDENWRAAEDFTLDYFPIGGVPESRRGRFASLVARAYQKDLISSDTASIYLACTPEEFEARAGAIAELS